MGITKPFRSENPEINELMNWVVRNFSPKTESSRSLLHALARGREETRDAKQADGEMRFSLFEDKYGKFLQPVVKYNNIDYPFPGLRARTGQLRFLKDSTVWDDLTFSVASVRLGGGNPADEVAYKDGLVISFDDAVDEYAYFVAQMPHGWQIGSDIGFHIHWTPKVNGAGGGVENVKWDLTYSWGNISGTFPASSSLTATKDVQDDSADDHLLTELGTIAGTDKTLSSCLICSLKRDTSVANNYGDEAYVVAMDFHIKKDTVGSDLEYDK